MKTLCHFERHYHYQLSLSNYHSPILGSDSDSSDNNDSNDSDLILKMIVGKKRKIKL